MIKGVIFDFGGVITTSPFEAFARYEREQGLPRDFLRTVNATNPDSNAWARFERSELNLTDFDTAFAAESEALGHKIPGADVIALLAGDIRPDMVVALEKLKARLPIGCITNNVPAGNGPGMAFDQASIDAVGAVMDLFDFVLESSKLGVRKPDPRIYQMALDQMGTQAQQTVFLDDLGINLKPARALGLTTIKVTDSASAITALEAAVGFSLRQEPD